MLRKDKSQFEVKELIRNFLRKHKDEYTKEEMQFILNNANWGRNTNFVSDLIRQVYDELDLIEPEKNMYLGFIDILYNECGITKDKHILEVGGGMIPTLSKRLANIQEQGKVTVYDPRIIISTSKKENLVLKKENFTLNSDVSEVDMIIGFMPCTSTETLIKKACANNIDFCVALCDGHNTNAYYDLDDALYDWQAGIFYEAQRGIRDNNMGTLETASLEKYDDPYPVLYNKRK